MPLVNFTHQATKDFTPSPVAVPIRTPTFTATSTLTPNVILNMYPTWIRQFLCKSNAYYENNPLLGKTARFQTPIDINPHGIPEVLDAIKYYEAMTSGAIRFNIVDSDPTVGITIIEGDALNRDGFPGCGHVTLESDPYSGFRFITNNDGVFNSLLYIHLGSYRCNPLNEGFCPCAIAEHELAHALGLGMHFPGFTGIEGLTLEPLMTITALYRVPPGTDMTRICTEH